MLNEPFLNLCYSIILGKSKIKVTKNLYRDVIEILEFCEDKQSIDIPIILKNKVDCLKKICQLKIDNKSNETIIDNLSFSEKYKQLLPYLEIVLKDEIKTRDIESCIKHLRLRKKFNGLLNNFDKMSKFMDSFRDSSFDTIDEVTTDFEFFIRELYSNINEYNRGASIESLSSLDLMKDDYESVIQQIKSKFERKNTIKTGYHVLDEYVLNGGFEQSRLYIIGGGSGSGKSTLLLNLIKNSSMMEREYLYKDKNIENVFIYITLENTVDESFLNLYMLMFEKRREIALLEISKGLDIKKCICDELKKYKSTIIIKYYCPRTISAIDIMSMLDEIIEEYGKEAVKALYIDYLDLLKTDLNYDAFRLELGYITLSLKSLAVDYSIPLITATQLGRSVYRVVDSSELELDQISESIKKVEHSDFVCMLVKDKFNDEIVHFKVGKNRVGKSNISAEFLVNFSIYKFLNCVKNNKDPKSKKNNSYIDENLSFFSNDNSF